MAAAAQAGRDREAALASKATTEELAAESLRGQVASLEEEAAARLTRLVLLTAECERLRDDVQELRGRVATAEEERRGAVEEKQRLVERCAGLETDKAALKGQVSGLEEEMAKSKARVQELGTEAEARQAQV